MAFASVMMWAVFLVPSAHAQSNIAVFSQGVLASTTSYLTSGATWAVNIGNGYTGTTTGAFVAMSVHTASSPGQGIRVILAGYSDSGYTTNVANCAYTAQDITGPYTASATSTNPFTQLTHVQSGLDQCSLNPNLYYKILVNYQLFGTGEYASFAGNANWIPRTGWSIDYSSGQSPFPPFFPQFAIVSNGFQITPTASSSGIFFSGAVDYCNSAFASSTGIGATIGNGLCIATGFLFVPTAASIQQFQDFSTALQNVIPFSYYYDVSTIFTDSSASSTQNMVAYSANLSVLDAASSTGFGPILPTSPFDFFSSTTISHYLPVGMHDFLYTLMQTAIWVEVLFLLYRRIIPNKPKI